MNQSAASIASEQPSANERAIVTETSKIALLLDGAAEEHTEAFFCGASFAVALKVSICEICESGILLSSMNDIDSRIVAGSTCTLTFVHRGVRVVCTSQVIGVAIGIHGAESRIQIEVPRFLAIRELRRQARFEISDDLEVNTSVVSFGKSTFVRLLDLSTDGARVQLNPTQLAILKVGDPLELRISRRSQQIRSQCQIRWIRDDVGGVSFDNLDAKQRANIIRFLNGLRSNAPSS